MFFKHQATVDTSEEIFSKDVIDNALDRMASEINEVFIHGEFKNEHPVVISVLMGGLIPTGHLMTRFEFDCQLDVVRVGSYGNGTQAGELQWQQKPSVNLQGRTVLLVDDILDTGKTLATVAAEMKNLGASRVLTAVVLDKTRQREASHLQEANFTALSVKNKPFVFGFGLDLEGYCRQIFAIRKVNPVATPANDGVSQAQSSSSSSSTASMTV